jgi:competence protein ComEA
MKRLRRLITDWLGFSRTEANGFLILLPSMILLIMSEPVYRSYISSQDRDFSTEQKKLDSLTAQWLDEKKYEPKKNAERKEKSTSIFAFDPNKITVSELQSLGFSERLSNRIANYRQKGGVFRIKDDLAKIYGIDSTLYHQLYEYILLPESIGVEKKDTKKYPETSKKTFVAFDINKADTAQLKSIYGIGNVLALRIVNFRDGLGGFIQREQIKEVYGLDSAVITRLNKAVFIEETFEPKKININTSNEKILSVHPYIKKSLAKAIMAYRFQHGDFADVREVLNISSIPPQQAERLIPYLKVKD